MLSHIKNIIYLLLFFAGVSIAISSYVRYRPISVKETSGFILSIEPMGSFNKKCFKIKLAVKGIKKTTWEPGSKSVIAPNEMNFFVCEKDGQQIRVARQAMDESEKVSILYIDEYYPIEEKLFDFRYIIATIKIKKK